MPRFAGTDMDTEAALGAFSGKQTVLPNSLDATDAEQLAHRIDALLAFGIRQGFYGSWMTSAQMPFGLLDNDGRTPRTSLIAQLHRWWGVSRVDVASENATTKNQTTTDTNGCVAGDNSVPLNGWDTSFSGVATYTYTGYKGGALMLDPIQSHVQITALNPTQLNLGGFPLRWPVLICVCRVRREAQPST